MVDGFIIVAFFGRPCLQNKSNVLIEIMKIIMHKVLVPRPLLHKPLSFFSGRKPYIHTNIVFFKE